MTISTEHAIPEPQTDEDAGKNAEQDVEGETAVRRLVDDKGLEYYSEEDWLPLGVKRFQKVDPDAHPPVRLTEDIGTLADVHTAFDFLDKRPQDDGGTSQDETKEERRTRLTEDVSRILFSTGKQAAVNYWTIIEQHPETIPSWLFHNRADYDSLQQSRTTENLRSGDVEAFDTTKLKITKDGFLSAAELAARNISMARTEDWIKLRLDEVGHRTKADGTPDDRDCDTMIAVRPVVAYEGDELGVWLEARVHQEYSGFHSDPDVILSATFRSTDKISSSVAESLIGPVPGEVEEITSPRAAERAKRWEASDETKARQTTMLMERLLSYRQSVPKGCPSMEMFNSVFGSPLYTALETGPTESFKAILATLSHTLIGRELVDRHVDSIQPYMRRNGISEDIVRTRVEKFKKEWASIMDRSSLGGKSGEEADADAESGATSQAIQTQLESPPVSGDEHSTADRTVSHAGSTSKTASTLAFSLLGKIISQAGFSLSKAGRII